MRNARLFTVAVGMFACTHSQTNSAICIEDSIPQRTSFINTTSSDKSVVTQKQHVANVAPELPFFKDVLSSKGLFW